MYYDDIGLFRPAQIGKNGYRYYNFKQNIFLESVLLLRKLLVPLNNIKKYFENYTQENLLDLLYAQEAEIDLQIAELKRLKRIVRNKIDIIEDNKKIDFNKIYIVEMQMQSIIKSESFVDKKEEDLLEYVCKFMKDCYSNNFYSGYPIGAILNVEKIPQSNMKRATHAFYLVDKKYEQEAQLSFKPKGRYLVAYHCGDWNKIHLTYQKIKDFANENKLVFENDHAYEERLFGSISNEFDDKENYFEIKISILLKE